MSRDLIYWGNQYGHGIVIRGALLEKITAACAPGETPEEFMQKVLDRITSD